MSYFNELELLRTGGWTCFFRDFEAIEALKTHVYPAIVGDKGNRGTIRMWAPGCSTGEETYSLAMTLLEFLGDRAHLHSAGAAKENHPHSALCILGSSGSVSAFAELFSTVDKKHKTYGKKSIASRLHYDFVESYYPVHAARGTLQANKVSKSRPPVDELDVQAHATDWC